jgi:oligosaccharide repeat unit polymerase
MSIISLTGFVCCLAILASALRRDADALSPARVFAFVWAFAIALTDLKLSGLQHTWAMSSWVALFIGVSSFLLGTLIAFVHYLGKPLLSIESIRRSWTNDIDERRLFISIAVVFSLYLFAYLVITFIKGVSPPLFSAKPWIARKEFTMFAIGLFLHNVVIVAFFSVVYVLIAKQERRKKWIVLGMTAVSILTYFFLLQRLQIMMTAIVCATLIYYTTNHLRKSTVLWYFVGASIFFLLVSSLRAGQVLVLYLYTISKMSFSPAYAIFTEPYMYVAMNLENFARSVARLDSLAFGYYTFDFATAIVGIKHWISEYFSMVENPYLVSNYNTYTAFWTYYRDFGVFGIAVIPALLGWGIASAYYWLRTNPNIRNLTFYSISMFVMFMSFFNSPIGFLWFVYNAIVIVIVLRYIRIRSASSAVNVQHVLSPGH